jgi:DNA-binding CsgD family transcriptional regulator
VDRPSQLFQITSLSEIPAALGPDPRIRERGVLPTAKYEKLLDLTAGLYRTAIDKSLWPHTLRQICSLFQCSGIDLFILERTTGLFPFSASFGMEADAVDECNEFFIKLELQPSSAPEHSHQERSSEYLCIEELKINGIPAHCAPQRSWSLRSYLSANPCSAEVGGAYVSLRRPKREGDLDDSTAALYAASAPHLAQAISIATRFDELNLRAAASGNALEYLPFGIILLDTDGHVSFMNQAANRVIASRDGLCVDKQRLYALKPRDNAKLQTSLVKASAMTSGKSEGRSSMALARPSGLRAYALFLLPLSRPESSVATERQPVAVFVSDPEKQTKIPEELLSGICGLTKTEAALSSRLACGLSITEAAEQQGISPKTARLHLDHIFRKTETHRQADLVRFLLTSLASVRHDDA